jgi:hypothetical protein
MGKRATLIFIALVVLGLILILVPIVLEAGFGVATLPPL